MDIRSSFPCKIEFYIEEDSESNDENYLCSSKQDESESNVSDLIRVENGPNGSDLFMFAESPEKEIFDSEIKVVKQ